MPMIDLTLPEDALDEAARHELLDTLTRTLLKWEGVGEDNPMGDAVTWGVLHPVAPGDWHVAHARAPADQPRYRVLVTVPEGALDQPKKEGLVAELTRKVLEAEGSPLDLPNALRVWVFIHEVPDGHWGGAGRIFRLRDIAKMVMGDAEAVLKETDERLRQPVEA
jgi:phenylpyruvate tautomerase PptA (4-oxalocrotonate tautomerase family)